MSFRSLEQALLSSDRTRDRLPWGGTAISAAIRLAHGGPGVVERRATPLSQCLEQEEDIEGFVIEEDDLESTLVRESYKHGVLVNSSRFYAYVKEDARRTRHRRPRWESLFLPSSRFQLAWNVIIVAVTVMMSVIEPFVIAFDYPMKLKGRGLSAAPIIDFVAGALFFIDTFVVNFLEAKVLTCRSTGRRKLITTPRLIRKIYTLEGSFVTDVIVSVPFVVQIIASIKGESTPVERLTRILRLLRVLRVTGSSLTTPEILFMKLFRMTPMVIFIAQTLLVFALLVHSVACVYIFVAIQEGRNQSWLTQADLADGSNSEIYIVALYFATATITTVGFGDISAGSNDLERCISTVAMIVGAIFFAYLVGSMGASIQALSTTMSRQRKFRERVTRVHAFLDRQHAPTHIRRHIMSFISEVEPRRTFLRENEEIMKSLPTDLMASMAHHMLAPNVGRIFGNVSNGLCQHIVSVFELVVIEPGMVIDSGYFYVVTEGVVAISSPNERKMIAVLTGQADAYLCYFGLDELIPPERRKSVRASALTVCELWRARASAIEEIFKSHPFLAQIMLEKIRSLEDDEFSELLAYRVFILESFLARFVATRESGE